LSWLATLSALARSSQGLNSVHFVSQREGIVQVSSLTRDVVIVGADITGLLCALSLIERVPRVRSRLVLLHNSRCNDQQTGLLSSRAQQRLRDEGILCNDLGPRISGLVTRTDRGWSAPHKGELGQSVARSELAALLRSRLEVQGVRVSESIELRQLNISEGGAQLETSCGSLSAAAVISCERDSIVRRALSLSSQRHVQVSCEEKSIPERERELVYVEPLSQGLSWDMPSSRERRSLVHVGAPSGVRYDIGVPSCAARGPLMLIGEAAGVDALCGPSLSLSVEYGALAGRFLSEQLGGPLDAWSVALKTSRLGLTLMARQALSRASLLLRTAISHQAAALAP
jgi:flavin-dependent dehydrogenase